MKSFVYDMNISLKGEELFDEIYEAFKHGVKMGIEEANYTMVKKLANLNIDLALIADLADMSIEDVAYIITEKNVTT